MNYKFDIENLKSYKLQNNFMYLNLFSCLE